VYEKAKHISRKAGYGGGIEVRDKQARILDEINEVKN